MGLPDMQAFHDAVLEQMQERVRAGMEDPAELMKPYITGAWSSWEAMQKLFMAGMNPPTSGPQAGEGTKNANSGT